MRLMASLSAVLCLGVIATAATAEEKTAKEHFYEELMGQMLKDTIDTVPSGMSEKPGDKNTYREGIRGFAHKAFASCLTWDKEMLTVSYWSWDAFGSPDWSYAEFGAMRACLKKKKRAGKDCKCQLIDHDDENVLKIPDDFLELYEKNHAAQSH